MSYQVLIERRAQKEIFKLPAEIQRRVSSAIDDLANDPRPTNCKKLSGGGSQWRVRVGDYRILYEVNDKAKQVLIYAVGHRRFIYR